MNKGTAQTLLFSFRHFLCCDIRLGNRSTILQVDVDLHGGICSPLCMSHVEICLVGRVIRVFTRCHVLFISLPFIVTAVSETPDINCVSTFVN